MDTAVEFRVLGPVEVWIGRRQRPLAGPKPRLLLLALLLAANRPVTVDRLINLVWGEHSPQSAAANVRGYVAGLRNVLACDGLADRIVRQSGGLLIRAEPGEVDAFRFSELVNRARTARDLQTTAAHLRQALDLWRGEVGGGVLPGSGLQADAAILETARISATETLAETLMGLGRPADAIDQLRRLIAVHPFREQSWEGLIRALYAEGDIAAALETYQHVRTLLAEELGIEPGARLQELQQAMLRRDPLGAAGIGEATTARTEMLWQAPAAVSTFVGRDAEVSQLIELLAGRRSTDSPTVATICGLAGSGKSALAVHVAHRLREHYPDGCLYVDLRGTTPGHFAREPLFVIDRFLRALGAGSAPPDLDEALARLRSVIIGSRLLLVFDNAAGVDQVRPLVSASAGCGVIITSRRVLTAVDDASYVGLAGLDRKQSIALLEALLCGARVRAEPAAATAIAGYCADLPLALRIAAGRLVARPAWRLVDFAERLADDRRRLDELQIVDLGVRPSLEASYTALVEDDKAAANVLTALGLFGATEITVDLTAALLGLPSPEAESALERLVDDHLLESPTAGRYELSELVRLFVRDREMRVPP